ncbi:helix-turn-helix domain-containing protein [Terribacillus halophilus]|uniref:helix-turn-helix domain-containing protein n=1 Tax=Terribacillus halophilus TaxID=361279 RepID=UPI000987724F|nr:helix-turn-helix domain-containing protein [Terribacillus halophilus]
MLIAAITFLAAGIILWIFSFFMQDKFKNMNQQIEQLTLSTMQETYTMNKKIKVLEEELLPTTQRESKQSRSQKPAIFQKVQKLHQQGYSIKEIANETGLAEDDVYRVARQTGGQR